MGVDVEELPEVRAFDVDLKELGPSVGRKVLLACELGAVAHEHDPYAIRRQVGLDPVGTG